MVNIGAQYYRPPFPDVRYWEEDFKRITDAGLNTVQLWVIWGWVEPSPGEFCFDDYDRLIELADKYGLGVVLSTLAEIQPYWIHSQVPDSEMVNNMGQKVVSSNRAECNFGITPGGCFDNPGIWQCMARFLTEVVARYRSVHHLRGWDAWNELRWCVNANGLVCYCPHTLDSFHNWLKGKYGGLDKLNEAWKKRYRSWDDVLPGKMPGLPFTEMMSYEHFITCRAVKHGKARYDLIKGLDPSHPVTLHGAAPCIIHGCDSYPHETTLHRGNDWFFADFLDGIGTSNFPAWFYVDDDDYTARIDFLLSSSQGKRIWLSELQGGRAATGFITHQPVLPSAQARWVWTGISRGVDTILFWCWRDEVFGRESSGFGITGSDGLAEARISALKKTSQFFRKHENLFKGYKSEIPKVGIFFSPQTYYLHWAQDGKAEVPMHAIQGYARALVRNNISFTVVEEEHLDIIEQLKVLFLPRTVVVDDGVASKLSEFVKRGGILITESECGAFSSTGFYRYPEDRFLTKLTGVCELGRRTLPEKFITISLNGKTLRLPVVQWLTPFKPGSGNILGDCQEGVVSIEANIGKGKVLFIATYLGDGYFKGSSMKEPEYREFSQDFETFIKMVVRMAGIHPSVEVLDSVSGGKGLVHVKTGKSGENAVAFIFFRDECPGVHLRFPPGLFGGKARNLFTGELLKLTTTKEGEECYIERLDWGVAVLVQE